MIATACEIHKRFNSWKDDYIPIDEMSEYSEEYYTFCDEMDDLGFECMIDDLVNSDQKPLFIKERLYFNKISERR